MRNFKISFNWETGLLTPDISDEDAKETIGIWVEKRMPEEIAENGIHKYLKIEELQTEDASLQKSEKEG